MIPNDQPLRSQMIKRMLEAFINNSNNHNQLTKWEADFIDSIYEQFESRGDLSNKQCEILERLYDKI